VGALSGVADFIRRAAEGPTIQRVEPLEGTNMSLWNSVIPAFWQDTFGTPWMGDAQLAERVWVSNRCQQLNAQQIASMPLNWEGPPAGDTEPAWISSPDENWYPNGIGDAIHAIIEDVYGWGFSCLYIADRYSDGFPRAWTVLPSGAVNIRMVDGRRAYKLGETDLDPDNVVQIDRNPRAGQLHGTSALCAYAQQAWGLLAAGNKSLSVSDGGVPQALLKKLGRPPTPAQAQEIQAAWMAAAATRGAAPAVIGENLEYEALSFNPSDLSLLETQEWNARVIATAYGVPSVILNMALQGGLTYQNPAALGEMWWRFELRPTATRVANALSEQMLPRGQWVWFDAGDTFAPIGSPASTQDDEQAATETAAAPAQDAGSGNAGLTVVGGGQ
jgi:hypothetical protein